MVREFYGLERIKMIFVKKTMFISNKESVDKDKKWYKTPYNEKEDKHLALLKKYMSFIDAEESTTFVCNVNDGRNPVKFTKEEVEILKKIDKELENEL